MQNRSWYMLSSLCGPTKVCLTELLVTLAGFCVGAVQWRATSYVRLWAPELWIVQIKSSNVHFNVEMYRATRC